MPFLRAFRNNPDITDLHLEPALSPKTAAYADDLLFFLSNLLFALPNLLSELKTYKALSFLRINYHKSGALNISMPASLTALNTDFLLNGPHLT